MMLKRIRNLFGKRGSKSTPVSAATEDAAARASVPIHRGPRVVHRPIPLTDLDPDAVKIVQRLTRFDHSAYLVGGCVRDLLLERRPKDFDLGTSATPRQVKRLFRNSRIIGRRFRLAHIYFQNGKIIEVATFRSRDGDDDDNQEGDLLIRDDNRFGSAEEDALRRDFTINALFYDLNNETVLDHAEGLLDLRRRLVRTIGEPVVRFREDPIRILRAIKFAARLDFTIESATLRGLERSREEIPKAAPPRVLEEINRFCRGGAARRSFELLRETRVFEVILPELATEYERGGGAATAWSMLEGLLSEIDRRHAEGIEAGGGEILTALLLPAIRERLGLRPDGSASFPAGLDVRALVDDVLRPIALRLRFPRRDQERCRLTVLTLMRMISASRSRRSAKSAILRRTCLPDALWMLDALAGLWGGEFESARAYWKRAVESVPQSERTDRSSREPRARKPAPVGKGRDEPRRQSRSRRPRQGDRTPKPGGGRESRPEVAASSGDFFANLPTVPEIDRDDGAGDRYGADALRTGRATEPMAEPPTEPAAEPAAEPATGESPAPRSGRRRRSRRRRNPAGEPETGPTDSVDGTTVETASGEATEPGGTKPRRRRRSRRRRGGTGATATTDRSGTDDET